MAVEIEMPQKKVWGLYEEFLRETGRETSLCWSTKDPAEKPFFVEHTLFANGTLIVIGVDSDKEYSRLFAGVSPQEWNLVKEANQNGLSAASVLDL